MGMSTTAATLSITQTVALYTVFLPELTDVKRHTPGRNPMFADDVRYAELTAGAVAVGIAAIVCVYEKSWQPLVATLIVAAVLTTAYEVALRQPGTAPNLVNLSNNA